MRHTIQTLSRALRDRSISPVELTRDCLARIEAIGPRINAFITVTAEQALEQARVAEAELERGEVRGPLHGVPVGLKDLIDTAGVRTTAASEQWRDRVPTEDAEVVRRLREAGAIILGKQNLHEFAYGGSSLVGCFGESRNPWDLGCLTGGSSGGSASSVAAGLGFAALGTDTAGSIRLPASHCGVVGLKATYGRVSARGVAPLSWSYDHVGPLATSVFDVAAVLEAIAGYDPDDPGSVDAPAVALTAGLGPLARGLRIGVPRAFFFDGVEHDVAVAIEAAIDVFRHLGAVICDGITLNVPTDRKLANAEAYVAHEPMWTVSPERYQSETLPRVLSGERVTLVKALRAHRELLALRHTIGGVFDDVDVLLTPTVPIAPPGIAAMREHPDELRRHEMTMLRNTRPFNVWGIPAISVPCGFTAGGLPMGLQLAGPAWREDVVVKAAYAYEQATEWHEVEPVACFEGGERRS